MIFAVPSNLTPFIVLAVDNLAAEFAIPPADDEPA